MKTLSHLLLILLLFSVLSLTVFSQKKDDPPGANASLEEIQKWLVKTIGKNSVFEHSKWEERIRGLKFDGCQFTYSSETKLTSDRSYPDISDQKPMGTLPGTLPTRLISYISRSFNLKDMDPTRVTSQTSLIGKDMSEISISTVDDKMLIEYKMSSLDDKNISLSSFKKEGKSYKATLTIKPDVTEQVKNAFIYAIKLCQQQP